jgi:hypothetical protein
MDGAATGKARTRTATLIGTIREELNGLLPVNVLLVCGE